MHFSFLPEKPFLKGLVLAGGESSRMGKDKGLIDYHGIPQREYVFELLSAVTKQTFISCKPGQMEDNRFPVLEDAFFDLGPFGAVLTAFQHDSSCAWFVVACDFPLLDLPSLSQLVTERDPSQMATCFWDDKAQLPEPWITILEPRIHPVLIDYHQRGKSSLRGILEDHRSHNIVPMNSDILLNANSPAEEAKLRAMIK
jgi:molybdopterin-guanine dinucleotide biosynthesis protein A